ncbi:MAG: hypothetical protein COU10_01075 [Candidatus Harrisonbacteria bacterium CG10_big_fil_rev_8_21_14_0_10_45_28]|uniref:Uncharacterized protein n=1 Tax=Candidatus Harrisonbacteria bacterium CG10_big_fil_rev_8_21_14_0_10_45_28 TaxID=1974586 RepID=A0A2H0UNU4_9BACT|nr:MAG: hypothetical protein COU10_01075 [Candidatus Harrisonbacteria bacterium CG10_big_fil_rev_8_21_14_0_10_45_28]
MKEKYLSLAIIVLALVIGMGLIGSGTSNIDLPIAAKSTDVELAIPWHDMGAQLAEHGVIDEAKFRSLYPNRQDAVDLVFDSNADKPLIINQSNADIMLNALWAFGLANKNPILEEGPMMDPRYGGADRFASTGGWTLGREGAMSYYSQFSLVVLTDNQQGLVERVSKNVYRPCCSNSTYFPDCNHGMAMLGLLEILAADGAGEDALYEAATRINEFWFGKVVGGSC